MKKYFILKKRAVYLPIILVLTMSFITISMVMVELTLLQRKNATNHQSKITALGVAEAGVSYYLWHLSHNNTDYTDGNSVPASAPYGPYIHEYKDNNGKVLGTYSLIITPPGSGSTFVTVESTGSLANNSQTRTVKALLSIPSFSQYAIVSNSELWFGATENTNGPVHSNVGIHFDGTNNGIISSSNATYVPTTPFGGNDHTSQNGVWGDGGPTSQWVYPVPTVNFQQVTADLANLKQQAQSNGVYLAKTAKLGYYIQFQNDGTYKLATVNTYTFSALTTTALVSKPIPTNGIIFAEDNVWVDGTVKGKYTVVAATLPAIPSTYRDVTIINNLKYTIKDGTDTLGIIAQRDIKVGPKSPDAMEINGALLAQNGRVYRPCRWNDASPCFKANGSNNSDTYNIRTQMTMYGAIASSSYWNWSWIAGINGTIKSGYINTTQTYDDHMLFSPPPSFPTAGNYAIASWREQLSP